MGPPSVISLFCGCGGSSLGYRAAGFRELLAIDLDSAAVESFKLNFQDVPVWRRDIRGLTGKEILSFCGLSRGKLDVLDGSPPCQGFSTINTTRRVTDGRNDLVGEYVRLVSELNPRAFVMENVSGITKSPMRGLFNTYLRELSGLGYAVKAKLMNAKYYGVPQSRERLILIGIRADLGLQPAFPVPDGNLVTVRAALAGCPDGGPGIVIEGKQKKVALAIRPGGKGSDLMGAGKWFSHRKLRLNAVACTIPREAWQIYNPVTSAPFSIPELKRLFSYPDDFMLIGDWRTQSGLIGNSVPPLMMKAIAQAVRNTLSGVDRKRRQDMKLS